MAKIREENAELVSKIRNHEETVKKHRNEYEMMFQLNRDLQNKVEDLEFKLCESERKGKEVETVFTR